MTGSRNLLWLIPIILVVALPFAWRPLATFLAPRGGFDPGPTHPEQIKSFKMQDVLITQSKKGTEEFSLRADRVYTSGHEDILALEAVRARIVGNTGRTTYVSGGEALYDTGKHTVTLMDDAKVITADGYRMQTDVLRYLSKYKVIKTAAAVSLTGKDMHAAGNSLFYDLDTGAFRLGGRLQVDLNVKDER